MEIIYHVDRFYSHRMGKIHRRTLEGWMGIRGVKDAELKSKDKYREHYAIVRRVTPKERLLEYKLSDGWGPLCAFLGKPIPEIPFPHVNEREYLDEKVRFTLIRGMKRLLWKIVLYSLPLLCVVLGYRWYSNGIGCDH